MQKIPVRHIASAEKALGDIGRFSIRSVEQVLNGKDLIHDLHRHNFFFILVLRKGDGWHEIDFAKYKVHDNSIFILRPGQVHKLSLIKGCSGYLVEFDQAFYQPENINTLQRWKKASGRTYCEVEASRFMKFESFLTNIFNELIKKEEGYLEAIKANLDLFFLECVRQSRNPKSKADNTYTQDRFEELVRLLEINIGSIKNASQYADLLSLSSYQLNAITKASVGKTVSDLINEQIILEAKRFLLATPSQIKEIADYLGYEDVSYFIRFFKRHTGHSPESFRKNFK